MIVFGTSCENLESQQITIIGKAMDAKAGAVVVSDDKGIYYLDGLASWDKKFYAKKVKVVGKLVIEERKKRENVKEVVQEIVGTKKIIKNPKWILVE